MIDYDTPRPTAPHCEKCRGEGRLGESEEEKGKRFTWVVKVNKCNECEGTGFSHQNIEHNGKG